LFKPPTQINFKTTLSFKTGSSTTKTNVPVPKVKISKIESTNKY
jgi:hypothetical protein